MRVVPLFSLPLVRECLCGLSVLGFDKVPWWGTLLISIGCSLLTALIVWFIVCPRLKKKIERKLHAFNWTRLFSFF